MYFFLWCMFAATLTTPNLLAILLPIAILLSLLVGYLLGLLSMWCCRKRSESAEFTVPPNPMYEEVSQSRNITVEMTANEAYGQV